MVYYIKEVYLDKDNKPQVRILMKTGYKVDAESFLALSKELKPESKIYMISIYEDY